RRPAAPMRRQPVRADGAMAAEAPPCALLAALLAAVLAPAWSSPAPPTVRTLSGPVSGVEIGGRYAFRGVPYAESPPWATCASGHRSRTRGGQECCPRRTSAPAARSTRAAAGTPKTRRG
ncbi:unnamed protein product, partial [Prorocentrum cordatum]